MLVLVVTDKHREASAASAAWGGEAGRWVWGSGVMSWLAYYRRRSFAAVAAELQPVRAHCVSWSGAGRCVEVHVLSVR